jgi:hypothetical protein
LTSERNLLAIIVNRLFVSVVYVSGLSILDCSSFWVLLPMLSTSLDCPYLIPLRSVSCCQCFLRLWIVHTWLLFVLCLAPNVVYVSGLSILDCSSFCVLFPMLTTSLHCPYLIALRSVSCTQCCLRLWIDHTWLLFVLCLAPNVVYVLEQDTERRAIKYGQCRDVDNIGSKTQNEEKSSMDNPEK